MHTLFIPEANKTLYIPEDLSQCDAQQYMDICELMFRHHNGEISFEDFKIHGFYKLAGLKRTIKENPTEYEKELELEKMANVVLASDLLDTFFEDINGQKTIKQYYTHNPVPSFKRLLGIIS